MPPSNMPLRSQKMSRKNNPIGTRISRYSRLTPSLRIWTVRKTMPAAPITIQYRSEASRVFQSARAARNSTAKAMATMRTGVQSMTERTL